jgi:hypothetical protein
MVLALEYSYLEPRGGYWMKSCFQVTMCRLHLTRLNMLTRDGKELSRESYSGLIDGRKPGTSRSSQTRNDSIDAETGLIQKANIAASFLSAMHSSP